MAFNFLKLIFATVGFCGMLSCGPQINGSEDDENLIGNKLESISALKTNAGQDHSAVVLYDSLVQKIYQFNLDQIGRAHV